MDTMVLRTVYVDPDVDEQIRVVAAARGFDKADVFRRYLAVGMKAAKARPDDFEGTAAHDGPPLIFRTVYLNAKVDDRLRVEAFDAHTSKNDLVRRYVRLGMNLEVSP
jgi:hypothetical protein